MTKMKNPVYASLMPDGNYYFDKTWEECSDRVTGVKGAKCKKFGSISAAKTWLYTNGVKIDTQEISGLHFFTDGPYAFVDGSFNADTGVYGYGGFLDDNGKRYPLMGSGTIIEKAKSRNISGEMDGAMAAVRKAEELGIKNLIIYYDYKGIEQWPRGGWSVKTDSTKEYADFMNSSERTVNILFEKVPAHTGIPGNEMADVMAKSAVGIKLSKKQNELLQQALNNGENIMKKESVVIYTFDEALQNMLNREKKITHRDVDDLFVKGHVKPWDIGFFNNDGYCDETEFDSDSPEDLKELWLSTYKEFDTDADSILYIREGSDEYDREIESEDPLDFEEESESEYEHDDFGYF